MTLLLITLAFAVGFNLLLFIPAFTWKTDKLTDLSYGLTFFLLALALCFKVSTGSAHQLLALMVMIWAARLGIFLFIRIFRQKKDKRFDGMREDFVRFFRFWLLQGVSVWVILLPTILFFTHIGETAGVAGLLSILGFVIWCVGLLIETVADIQKFLFNQNPENHGKWIVTGLWKRSRHPNYLGEILVWVGVYIFTLPLLSPFQAIIALLSPIYIFVLLRFVTGVPLLEKSADAKWGSDPAYREYKSKSGILMFKL